MTEAKLFSPSSYLEKNMVELDYNVSKGLNKLHPYK
jgi:hypothetical protein